jgi:hypothetical protein
MEMVPMYSLREVLGMTCMLSKFTTDGCARPSGLPSITSCGMCLMVEVTSAIRTFFRYAYAADRVRRTTGRRPIGVGRSAHMRSNCLIGVCAVDAVSPAIPTPPDPGKHRYRNPAAFDTPQPWPALQAPKALSERHCERTPISAATGRGPRAPAARPLHHPVRL